MKRVKAVITPDVAAKIIKWQQALPDDERNDALINDCIEVLMNAEQPTVDLSEKERVWQNITREIGIGDIFSIKKCEANRQRGLVLRRPIMASLIACCLLFVMVGVALASGLLPWQLTVNRENGYFEFRIVSIKEKPSKTEMASAALPREFVDRLNELEIEVALPQYWPEGYSYLRMEENYQNEPGTYVICHFIHGMSGLNFCVESISDDGSGINNYLATYEMSGDEVRTYTNKDCSYIIYSNNKYMSAIWVDGRCILSITGDITEDELIQVIDSIEIE